MKVGERLNIGGGIGRCIICLEIFYDTNKNKQSILCEKYKCKRAFGRVYKHLYAMWKIKELKK